MPIRDASAGAASPAPRGRELPLETRAAFGSRDSRALGQVYDRYHRAVWALSRSITRDDHLAQEAMQDTFVRAWQGADRYDPARDLGPWLLTIARHATLDLLRRELRPTRGGHEVERDAPVEDQGLDQAWTAWQVQEAVARLDPDEALIVRLSFFDDLTHTQIAERLRLPVGTVKSRSHRAHRHLADLLAHLRDDPVSLPADKNQVAAARRIHTGADRRDGGGEPT